MRIPPVRIEASRSLSVLIALLFVAACVRPPLRIDRSVATSYRAEVVNANWTGGIAVSSSKHWVLWGTDGSIAFSSNGRDWAAALTPTQVDLARVASDSDGHTLVAIGDVGGDAGTILHSVDLGRTWQASNDVPRVALKAIVYHAPSANWIVAGASGTILRSHDALTWTTIASGVAPDFESLFVDASTGAMLIGGQNGTIGISHDAGATWRLTTIDLPSPATPIAGFERLEQAIIARSALGRFLISHDDGLSWDLMQSKTNAFFIGSTADRVHGTWLLFGHNGALLRSHDRGMSWQDATIEVEGRALYLTSVHCDESRGACFAVAHGGVIVRSLDGGESWQRMNAHGANFAGVLDNGISMVAFGGGGAIQRSNDGGANWRVLRDDLELYLRAVATLPRSGAIVATGQLGTLVRSTNAVHWQAIRLDYPDVHTPPDLRALRAAPDGSGFIAAGPPGAILRSSVDGSQWRIQQWSPIEASRAFPWILVDESRHRVVTVEAHGAMRISADGGGEWREVDARIEGEFWQGAVLEREGVMIIAGKAGAFARSVDGGAHWSQPSPPTKSDLFGSYADAATGAFFVMGQDGVLLRSTDLGVTWHVAQSDTTHPLRRMIRDPVTAALICFGGEGAIIRSADSGISWYAVDSGVSVELRDAVIDPTNGGLLIVGRGGVLLRSNDGGTHWARVPTHTQRNFTALAATTRGDLVLVGERIVKLTRENLP